VVRRCSLKAICDGSNPSTANFYFGKVAERLIAILC
jgi:hypothetical protein